MEHWFLHSSILLVKFLRMYRIISFTLPVFLLSFQIWCPVFLFRPNFLARNSNAMKNNKSECNVTICVLDLRGKVSATQHPAWGLFWVFHVCPLSAWGRWGRFFFLLVFLIFWVYLLWKCLNIFPINYFIIWDDFFLYILLMHYVALILLWLNNFAFLG